MGERRYPPFAYRGAFGIRVPSSLHRDIFLEGHSFAFTCEPKSARRGRAGIYTCVYTHTVSFSLELDLLPAPATSD